MDRKAVSGIMLTLLLIGMLTLAFNIQPVKASGTIYIRADGSVEPEGTPISSIDNITYTFTDNIYDEIVVERDNIVVDGAGYTVQGTGGTSKGITLGGRSNITIGNMKIEAFWCGILLDDSSNNRISGNNITENSDYGICISWHSHNNTISGNNITNSNVGILLMDFSKNNTISGNNISNADDGFLLLDAYGNIISGNKITNSNTAIHLVDSFGNNNISGNNITNNGGGIGFSDSSNNIISGNNITENDLYGIRLLFSSRNNTISENNINNNGYGIKLLESSNNKIYHNNLKNNTYKQASIEESGYANFWDDGYPSGGNYWSDYNGTDANQDGIGDTPYVIDDNNKDNYPLMGMFYDFTVEIEGGQFYHAHVISNSTVLSLQVLWWLTSPNEYLQPGDKFIWIFFAMEEGSVGFCRIMIPRVVLDSSYTVLDDWHEVPVTELPISNSTHAYLYFTFGWVHDLMIVPEFPTWTSMLLILIALTFAIAIYKRRLLKTPIH